jgi:site-specific recombinase XerD
MTPLALTRRESKAIGLYTEQAVKFAKQSKAPNTARAYKAAWAEFVAFASAHDAASLPAEAATVVAYLTALAEAGAKVSTIGVKRAAISAAHRTARQADPTTAEEVRLVMAGIARALGTAPQKKTPLGRDELRRVIAALPDTLAGQRDRALILVGWAGAFRRSELIAVDVGDVRLNPVGAGRDGGELKITIRKSKTDQEGKGMVKVIPTLADKSLCPVTALRAWLDAAGIQSGAIFRQIDKWGNLRERRLTAQSVALIVKAAAERAGIEARQFAGHSLRSGFITTAAGAGVDSRDIMAVSGHKSEAVMRGYIQDAGLGAKRAISAAFGERQ